MGMMFFQIIIWTFGPIKMDAHTLLPQTDEQRLQKEDFCDTVRPAEPRYGQTLVCRWNTSSDTDPSEQRYQPTSDDQTCRSKRFPETKCSVFLI